MEKKKNMNVKNSYGRLQMEMRNMLLETEGNTNLDIKRQRTYLNCVLFNIKYIGRG